MTVAVAAALRDTNTMHSQLAIRRPPNPGPAELFHPAVSRWLQNRFGKPTDVQTEAWRMASRRQHALIAAPTGSGKTLAAFLSSINDLVVEGLQQGLTNQVRVLYVSPLKALSNDIQKNLEEPLLGIRMQLVALGHGDLDIRDAVRTGDTPPSDRERMRRKPPHILVTTPESLFILLTSDSGRRMLASVRTVILDELHAVAGTKRGAHLMLSLERLDGLCKAPPIRLGLSATVKPLDDMARFLVGGQREPVAVIDGGHVRERDLALEVPNSPLTSVMATEVWSELYDRLVEQIHQHRTTLIFVNQRRMAERVARHIADRIGEEHVTSHHGSLAKEHRLQAEQRLKAGTLKALVATSSLELGIDIGQIDLVCQLGSPRAINAFLQRVGRAGHALHAIPKGRLFPLCLNDLLECSALLHAVNQGALDRVRGPQAPLDVLAQQIVAETSCREWDIAALYNQIRRAQPYRNLPFPDFEQVLQMLADGYATPRGRRGAYLFYDRVNRVVRARRGARLAALTNGGVIPDQFDYEVLLLPELHRIGTLNEDFAFESSVGDIFQLGNASYRVTKLETGNVYVEDARGQPPTIPFWLGEGLGRTDELCSAVSHLCEQANEKLDDGVDTCQRWLVAQLFLPTAASQQLTHYLAAAKAALGTLPTLHTIIFERFLDEVGDRHLVIHSPYGSRINRAWGLALRKRFCRKFNFELQASALEDSIVLSFGPTHNFQLDEIQGYLHSSTARDLLIQALLTAPMFATRWRWNASVALAVKRRNGNKRVPPQFQRSNADDLLTLLFPDQVACAENLVGDREIPDHPLVKQTLDDCLHETMDVDGFEQLLRRMESGEVRVVTADLLSPSPLSHAILNARSYAFLDNGKGEERRTQAVRTQPWLDLESAADLARLDPHAVEKVRNDAWPVITSADELHDALSVYAFLTPPELHKAASLLSGSGKEDALQAFVRQLQRERRVTTVCPPRGLALLVTAERLNEFLALFPDASPVPRIEAISTETLTADKALVELLRSRLELLGPVTEQELAAPFGFSAEAIHAALLQLEAEGNVMHGAFTSFGAAQWCDRRLLARMHRSSRDRLRAEVQPAAPAEFMRFLFHWHRLADSSADERYEGELGLKLALQQLEGFAAPAAAWEEDLLPIRIKRYEPNVLDKLCSAGRIVWYRPASRSSDQAKRKAGPIRTTPVMLCERLSLVHWQQVGIDRHETAPLSPQGQRTLEVLQSHGASFFSDLVRDTTLLKTEVEKALGELVCQGLVTCDSFAGLRALLVPESKRDRLYRRPGGGLDDAGRWSLTRQPCHNEERAGALAAPHVEHIARVLLRRYGVVFRKLLEREDDLPPWRDLHYVYRRLEARGEVRGGRFVCGFSGEQFALAEAAALLKTMAKKEGTERVSISAADPLNLAGIITPGEKVPRQSGNRLLFENGVPVAVQTGGDVHYLTQLDAKGQWELKTLLIRKRSSQQEAAASYRARAFLDARFPMTVARSEQLAPSSPATGTPFCNLLVT
jgi:ATP-dependent Lhr-like helicase